MPHTATNNPDDPRVVAMKLFEEQARLARESGTVKGERIRYYHESMLRRLDFPEGRVQAYLNAIQYPVGPIKGEDLAIYRRRAEENIGKLTFDA